ncbi:MAG TPA: hypothetical protein DEP23_03560 [Ruminococcaceae bacterium]|nr:hypothetical protein [Oscillospiraceae bacterium]
MFKTGLVSVSFRQESPETIVKATADAALEGVEWGGDIHVPMGDITTARRIGELTRSAGLIVMGYGSYYRLSGKQNDQSEITALLETAAALETSVIRIWAGSNGSAATPACEREAMAQEASMLSEIADNYRIDIALECHNKTLTDDWKSTLDFIKSVHHPRLKMYWQPNQHRDEAYNYEAALQLAPYTVNLHVFHWDAHNKYPLAQGKAVWKNYLNYFSKNNAGLLLEFMHDGQLESLPETAATLRSWIKK